MERGRRANGAAPVAVAIIAALGLTGAGFFTVTQAGCSSPGHYVRTGETVRLVGGCLGPADLPPDVGHPVVENPQQNPATFHGMRS